MEKRLLYEVHYPLSIKATTFGFEKRLCEVCNKREIRYSPLSSSLHTKFFRYRCCERCYQIVRDVKGAFLDDIADENDYIALLGWSLNSDEILFGRGPVEGYDISIMGYMSPFRSPGENFKIALFWSFDRAFERISDLFSSYALIRRKFVNKLQELEEKNQISRKCHIEFSIKIPEEVLKRLKEKGYLVKVDTREKSYAASLDVKKSKLELIGIPQEEIEQILEEKFTVRILDPPQLLKQKFEPEVLSEEKPEMIEASERVIIPYFDLEKCFMLMPAKLTIYTFEIIKNHLIFPIKKIGLRIKKKDYPLYEMLLGLKNEVVKGK